jgi:hypothetical protein
MAEFPSATAARGVATILTGGVETALSARLSIERIVSYEIGFHFQ